MAKGKLKSGILFTADMHLRDTVPPCRTDDFMQAQWDKVREVADIVKKENLYWVDAGDIFHTARPGYRLVNNFIERLRTWGVGIDLAIMGNHDMPGHNPDRKNMDDTAWYNLLASGIIRNWRYGQDGFILNCDFGNVLIDPVDYGASPCHQTEDEEISKYVCVIHDMVFRDSKSAIPGVGDYWTANQLLYQFPDFDYFICGHNHKSWRNGKVINVGCLTRQTADMEEHEPSVVVLNGEGCERRYLEYEQGVVSRAHIDKQEAQENQISSFVESLENNQEVSLSFEGNVQIVLNKTKPEKGVELKVRGAME